MFSTKLCTTLHVYKSCLISVACLNVSEYLPFLIPSGVLCFRKIFGKIRNKLLDCRYDSIQCWVKIFAAKYCCPFALIRG